MPVPLSDTIQTEIRAAFPGMFNVPLQLAAPFIGVAYKTARNQGDAFVLKTIKQGCRRFVSVVELARYLGAQEGCDERPAYELTAYELTLSPPDSAPPRRGPGRPPKLRKVGGAQ